MARQICIKLPDVQAPLSITVPGIGEVSVIRDFLLTAYSACQDVRALLQQLQPIFAALGLPLCVLGCVASITELFSTSFPFVDPGAIPGMVEACSCLLTFTPFGFCNMLEGIVAALQALLTCILGLLDDISALVAQAAALLANPATEAQGICLNDNSQVLLDTISESFSPVSAFFDATEFLFTFVGVPFVSVGDLAGGDVDEVRDSVSVALDAVNAIADTISAICP